MYNQIRLSESICDDIRKLFSDEQELWEFIKNNVDVDDLEAWDLIDQVFPEPCESAIKFIDYDGEEKINPDVFDLLGK